MLVNKVPMRRLCAVADVQPQALYARIGRLEAQCRALSAHLESQFLATNRLSRLHLNTDRQDHALNWGSALERQPISLRAVATADVASGYVLAQHLNYDPDANPRALELRARAEGDPARYPPFRRYARLWLPHEVQGEDKRQHSDADLLIPGIGGIVHETYTMAAHLQLLKPWVACADYVQFSLDQDPGLDRLCLSTFVERVRAGSSDAFLVRIEKALSVVERRQALARAEAELVELRRTHPAVVDSDLIRHVMMQRWLPIKPKLAQRGRLCVSHPYPTVTEPSRAVAPITWNSKREDARIVAGLSRATLRGVDRFFM